jgi:uncharacterized protein
MNSPIINRAENAQAIFVFAHGAGANMHHEFMTQISELLLARNISTIRFNFPYMQKRLLDNKRYPPDRMPKLLIAYQSVLDNLLNSEQKRRIDKKLPLFIGGKSMGSRAAAILMTEKNELSDKIAGLICLGYPFHPQKQAEKLRLEPLQQGLKPTLIIQGERDALGNKQEVFDYQLPSHIQCEFLEDGDHSFKPRVKSGFTLQQHLQAAVDHIVEFIYAHKK